MTRFLDRTPDSVKNSKTGITATLQRGGVHALCTARAGKGRKADILNNIESMGSVNTGPEQERLYLLKPRCIWRGPTI